MHPRELKIEDFTYQLPNEKIAYEPTYPRDSSKLLVYKKGEITQNFYKNIACELPKDSVLVFNDTKVIKSRIFFKKETGAMIEVFCLEPYGEHINHETFFQKVASAQMTCLIGKAGKWKEKKLYKNLSIKGQDIVLSVEIIEKLADSFVVEFSWNSNDINFAEIIEAAGVTPLPPYIKRIADKTDEDTYQTVYSEHEGSVAAPTAGLHFTQNIFDDLDKKGIDRLFTTLHVGAGTFMPVKSETMENHTMHAEYMNISIEFLDRLISDIEKTIISVGTTSMRTLESIFWMGNKVVNNPKITLEELKVTQWQPYQENLKIHSAEMALIALRDWIARQNENHLSIETQIIIAPGYSFKIVKGLITNFHQPQSTLLLLVSALIGENWHNVYDYALENDFRFLSYGDGSLLLP